MPSEIQFTLLSIYWLSLHWSERNIQWEMCEEGIVNRKNEFQEETKKERKRTLQQEIELHSFTQQTKYTQPLYCTGSIKFNLEELFYLVEVSQFDFSEEETSCGNERNARKKLNWNHKILNWNN